MPVPSGEVHLGVLPQTESLRSENMRDHAEQHQEDGHGHHDHVMADAARERNRERVNRVSAEWEDVVTEGRKSVCLAPPCHLLMEVWKCFPSYLVPMSSQLP